ncbi:MAG: hypothetical protein P8076_16255 [Gammaproteobacteria bacterium]
MSIRADTFAAVRGAATLLAALALAAGAGAWSGRVDAGEAHAAPALPLKAGYRTLGNAFRLKAYYYAYAHTPAVPAEFTRYRGDEKAAGTGLSAKVAAAVHAARTHPGVVLELGEVALRQYDPERQAFPMDNRLFIQGMRYYFDVSPYHYVFADARGLNPLPCRDPATVAEIGRLVAAYRQFAMRVYGQVVSADPKQNAVVIRVQTVQVFGPGGHLLLERSGGEQEP